MVDPPTQPATSSGYPAGWWPNAIRVVQGIAVLCLILGLVPLIRYLAALGPIDDYRHAAACDLSSPPSQGCFSRASVLLQSASYVRPPGGKFGGGLTVWLAGGAEDARWTVQLSGSAGPTQVIVPGRDWLAPILQTPVDAIATTYRGKVIRLDLRGMSLATADFPGVFADKDRLLATVFLAIGFPLLIARLALGRWFWWASRRPNPERALATGRNAFILAFRILVGLSGLVIVLGLLLLLRMSGLI